MLFLAVWSCFRQLCGGGECREWGAYWFSGCYLMGLMLTFVRSKTSFFPHFGQCPSNRCMISSGAVSSMPSNRVWPHCWQVTCWGMWFSFFSPLVRVRVWHSESGVESN